MGATMRVFSTILQLSLLSEAVNPPSEGASELQPNVWLTTQAQRGGPASSSS
jgi:hypothetical protein